MTLLIMLQHLVTLAGHLAWPTTAITILIIVRKELLAVFNALSTRISDPKTSIVLGKDGIEIKSLLNATLGKIESLESNQKQTADLVVSSQAPKTASAESNGHESSAISTGLMTLSDEYLNISTSDWRQRVHLKDEYASKMGDLVITNSISKDWLADQNHEGLLMALTSAIHLLPDELDFGRLSQIASRIQRLHVKYRLTMAIGRLFQQNLVKQSEVSTAKNILEHYETDADPPLKKRIEQTKSIIEYSFAVKRNPSLKL